MSQVPPEAWPSFLRIARFVAKPLERCFRIEAASGVLLFVAAGVAVVWTNSPWAESYVRLWHTPLGVKIGEWSFERTLQWLVNDVLMVIFFFVIGMEIRRELYRGELSEWRRAALPVAAALGGMIAPAALYVAIAGASVTRSGWGIPMATDIAFALGVLTLLRSRVPASLRILVLALAVIDDVGAIAIIALFYSSGISLFGILIAALGIIGIFAMQRFGVRIKVAYFVPSLICWAGIYSAGIHPTVAGVVIGLMTPVRPWLGPQRFVMQAREELDHLANVPPDALSSHELAEVLRHVNVARREALSPAQSLIESLHRWVAFGILPAFALANAGVRLKAASLDAMSWRVVFGVGIGLVVGKPLGILLATWLSVRLRLAVVPYGLTLRHLIVLSVTAGIGFTMALFIAQLAFVDARLLAAATFGILGASGFATLVALALGRLLLARSNTVGVGQSGDHVKRAAEA